MFTSDNVKYIVVFFDKKCNNEMNKFVDMVEKVLE